jgi:uncharacterized protein (DUF952 family)
MIYHLVALDDWLAVPDRPYSPASLTEVGFVHFSPDEATTLAVATAFYRETPAPLLALVVDEGKLGVPTRWEAADPAPPPGVSADILFPHVYGPIDRDAVDGMYEVVRDDEGRATGMEAWS